MQTYDQEHDSLLHINDTMNDTDMDALLDLIAIRRSTGGLSAEQIVVITLCIGAVLSNVTALVAIRGIKRALMPNQLLIASLCCADLLTSTGIFCYVLNTGYFNGYYDVADGSGEAWTCADKIVQGIKMTSHHATLLSLLCLSVDHYCAVALPLQQPQLMSMSRVQAMIAAIWVVSAAFGFSDFYIPAPLNFYCRNEQFASYCARVSCSTYEPDHLLFVVVTISFTVMVALYARIAREICAYQRQRRRATSASAIGNGSKKGNRRAYRGTRGLVTTIIIVVTFAILWLPYGLLDAIATLQIYYADGEGWEQDAARYMRIFRKATLYLYGLIVVNALVDPIIYAIRMREVQQSLRLLCGAEPCIKLRWKYRLCGSSRTGEGEALQTEIKARVTQPSTSNSSRVTAL